MTSITAADLKLGGRLVAACDAIAAGHLHKAASIFSEITDELNAEATANVMSEEPLPPGAIVHGALNEGGEISTPQSTPSVNSPPSPPVHAPDPQDLQMCARNVHQYGAADSNGWRACTVCGYVNVAPPDNQGFVDMGARR